MKACNFIENKLLRRLFLLCDWHYWLSSAGLFAIRWFTVFQNTWLAASAISLELLKQLSKCIVIQYPKSLYKDSHPKKCFWKMKSNICPLPFNTLKKICLHWNSFAPETWKRGTLRSIINKAYDICSNDGD